MPTKKTRLIIIDSNALIHRAFHALPPLTNKQGVLTNAVYGFTMLLIKAIKDLKPDYIAATFDHRDKTFRHQQYKAYKAQRKKQPDELYAQMPLVKEVLAGFKIKIYEQSGYEADDLIGTIAHLKSVDRPDIETIILTGDQDVLQLVDSNTKVLSPHKGLGETILYDKKGVKDKFGGLKPNQLIDYKALRGDPSDNIPGVKGIGEKGAINLLNDFKTLDGIYQNIESDKIKDRTRQLLKEYKDDAYQSQKLATIILDAPIDFKLEDCKFGHIDKAILVNLFQELNFTRLLSQLNTLGATVKTTSGQAGLFETVQNSQTAKKFASQKYQLVLEKDLQSFIQNLKKQTLFCFDTEATSPNPFNAELLGISFCWQAGCAHYLPLSCINKVRRELTQIFKDQKINKVGHNLKYDIELLEQHAFEINGIYFDTMIASYLLNPGHRQHNLDNLAFVELGYEMQKIEDLIGKGKNQITLKEVEVERVSNYSCEDADLTYQLYLKLEKELKKEGMFGLFEEMEMPLVRVLSNIERNGVKINDTFLKKLSKDLGEQIVKLETKIHKLAKVKFNIASPKQLKEVLFETMNLSTAGLAKTKTGISTAAGELDKLVGEHKIIDLILEYRELTKLKSTYSDALPKLINPKDHRVHTSYNQTVTATGRLSSSDPNLQNIPIRTHLGKKIRQSFIADKGHKLIKADYSQIELRIVASLANDKTMLQAFENKDDIHTQTAALINQVEAKDVTPNMRRQAKEVNFGVLYGMGAWGLAKRTGISNLKAKEFIDKYFASYSQVKQYLAETIAIARDKGYVETFYGRRRYIPEINSGVQQVRAAAERTAINMPIQGTAADLLKLAMIEIDKKLPKDCKMILQVHDELVFEVPDKDVKRVAELVTAEMNGVYKLRAPIETEVQVGNNWNKMELIQ